MSEKTQTEYPFDDRPDYTIAALGEQAIIERIRSILGSQTPPAPEGIGDDCALGSVESKARQLLTTDSLSYGIHFDAQLAANDAGRKLVYRNLSDIAGMGGRPAKALLSLLSGPDLATHWLEAFIEGVRSACHAYAVEVVGGDVSQTQPGQFSAVLMLTGWVENPLLRKTAHVGDSIYVTGDLGGSLLGRHYQFEPRLDVGQWLSKCGVCSSLMDLTDGIAKDLPALLPDPLGGSLDLERLPVSEAARQVAETTGRSALEHALCDGEDYELLFTLHASQSKSDFATAFAARFQGLRLTRIGEVVERGSTGCALIDGASGEPIGKRSGFEHFRRG